MKVILILTALFLLAPPLNAEEPRPSLLLMVEGQTGQVEARRPGVYQNSDQTLQGGFSALLELPASPKSSILIKAGLGRRVDDVNAFTYLGNARITQNWGSFGFGVKVFFK